MRTRYAFSVCLVIVFLLIGCTVQLNQPSAATPTSLAVTIPAAGSTGAASGGSASSTTIPMSWSSLKLTGKLIFIATVSDGTNIYNDIQSLDLTTGKIKTVFQSVPDGWIDSAVVSPNHSQIVMGYSTPAMQVGANTTPLGLFSIPMDGSRPPEQVIPLPLKDDQFIEPVWSPDGKYLYYVLANYGVPPEEPNQHYPIFQIFRMVFPDGQPEKLLDKAYWPRLSADGTRLLYVSENPDDGTNKLFVANSDGSNSRQITFSGALQPTIMDAPMLLPDGKTILFSSPTPVRSSLSWIEQLFGVIDASAHNLASDWFTVPLAGGTATQLTQVQAAGLYAAMSPDNQTIASYSGDGVFVMKPDGTNLTMIIGNLGGNPGTMNWIP